MNKYAVVLKNVLILFVGIICGKQVDLTEQVGDSSVGLRAFNRNPASKNTLFYIHLHNL